jgi:hypothetical protein
MLKNDIGEFGFNSNSENSKVIMDRSYSSNQLKYNSLENNSQNKIYKNEKIQSQQINKHEINDKPKKKSLLFGVQTRNFIGNCPNNNNKKKLPEKYRPKQANVVYNHISRHKEKPNFLSLDGIQTNLISPSMNDLKKVKQVEKKNGFHCPTTFYPAEEVNLIYQLNDYKKQEIEKNLENFLSVMQAVNESLLIAKDRKYTEIENVKLEINRLKTLEKEGTKNKRLFLRNLQDFRKKLNMKLLDEKNDQVGAIMRCVDESFAHYMLEKSELEGLSIEDSVDEVMEQVSLAGRKSSILADYDDNNKNNDNFIFNPLDIQQYDATEYRRRFGRDKTEFTYENVSDDISYSSTTGQVKGRTLDSMGKRTFSVGCHAGDGSLRDGDPLAQRWGRASVPNVSVNGGGFRSSSPPAKGRSIVNKVVLQPLIAGNRVDNRILVKDGPSNFYSRTKSVFLIHKYYIL